MKQYDEKAERYGYEGEMTPLKCDELKAINAYQLTTNTEDSDVYIHNDEFGCGGDLVDCYLKSKVDTAIAELKDAWRSEHAACEALKAKLENVQASAYAESVDAGMRERRPRRATNRELSRWLAQGNGECLGSQDDADTAWNYPMECSNVPLREGAKVRKWSDTEWHEPTVEYLFGGDE